LKKNDEQVTIMIFKPYDFPTKKKRIILTKGITSRCKMLWKTVETKNTSL